MTDLRWTIDVCRTCGRLAVWPGCEHWHSEVGWYVPVVVKPAYPSQVRRDLDLEGDR